MANPNKDKGDKYERDLKAHFREHGQPEADRRYGAGQPRDRGDIIGVYTPAGEAITIQAKDVGAHNFSGWLDQVEEQRLEAGTRFGIVISKRRRKRIGLSYVTMTLETFERLMGGDA